MKKIVFPFFFLFFIFFPSCIADDLKYDYFDGSKGIPLYMNLTIKNERNDDCVISVNIEQYLPAVHFGLSSVNFYHSSYSIKANENINLKDLSLADYKLSNRTVMSYKNCEKDENVGFVFPVIVEHVDGEEVVLWSGSMSRLNNFIDSNNECYYIFQRSKSGTESFGHLVSETDEMANGIESGTINAVLTLTDEGAEFSYVFD